MRKFGLMAIGTLLLGASLTPAATPAADAAATGSCGLRPGQYGLHALGQSNNWAGVGTRDNSFFAAFVKADGAPPGSTIATYFGRDRTTFLGSLPTEGRLLLGGAAGGPAPTDRHASHRGGRDAHHSGLANRGPGQFQRTGGSTPILGSPGLYVFDIISGGQTVGSFECALELPS
jgi:hypothetical protein